MHRLAVAIGLFAALPAQAETLRFFPPDGFTGVHVSQTPAVTLTEYVHEGEGLDGWTHAITLAEVRALGLSAPGLVARLSVDMAAGCEQAFDMAPELTQNGGRRSTVSIHACPNLNVTGRPEVNVLRVIEGKDGTLFAVLRSWVVTPPREELDEWTNWLRELKVCDDDGACS